MADLKEKIFYHRAHRRAFLGTSGSEKLLFLFVIILDIVLLIIFPEIVRVVSFSVKNLLSELGYQPSVQYWEIIYRQIAVLDMPAIYPTLKFSVGVLIFSTLLIILVLIIPRFPRLLAVYLVFLSLINIVSAFFFIVLPYEFPYSIAEFSILYLGTEVGLWVLLPPILALALYTLPTNLTSKILFILFNLAYSIIFGAVRYAAFLFLMDDFSVLFMALFYFAFGPLFDFVYLVGFYTLFVSNLADGIRYSFERWRWLF